MTNDVLVRTVTDLGRDWVWLSDASVLAVSAGLSMPRLAAALEQAAQLLRHEGDERLSA